MPEGREQVTVLLDSIDLGDAAVVGTLTVERSRGKTVQSFAYEKGWLSHARYFSLDQEIGGWLGEQYFDRLPGIFADTAPDRWGRTLIARREAILAKRENRRRRRLDDWDYLVGVADLTRMGALRLRDAAGEFIDSAELSVPPLTQLRQLEDDARAAELRPPKSETEEKRWLRMLIAPGSSLGGARPKANFVDVDGQVWIAKFPSRADTIDVGAWEYVFALLARRAGIDVPEAKLLRLRSRYATYAVKRFDRVPTGRRRLFASAMTLAGRKDGDSASYLDIATAIRDFGDPTQIKADQQQLFRRLLFNVVMGNRDDHLRNHGFLRTGRGWRLSPAFDVNPNPDQVDHALAIDDASHEGDLELALKTAPLYGVKEPAGILQHVFSALTGWEKLAINAAIPDDEIERVGAEFQLPPRR